MSCGDWAAGRARPQSPRRRVTAGAPFVATRTRPGASAGHRASASEAVEVGRRLSPDRDRAPGDSEADLLAHQERTRQWLTPPPGEKRGLRLSKVHELLIRHGVRVPYSSLQRFAIKHCGFAERRQVTVRMAECEPGDLAEVDFGRLGHVPDPETGRKRLLWVLGVVLPSSRHQYVHTTHSQKVPDLIGGLEDAWEYFGGTPRQVILDNLRAAVTRADRYDTTSSSVPSTSTPATVASRSIRPSSGIPRGSRTPSGMSPMYGRPSSGAKNGAIATTFRTG